MNPRAGSPIPLALEADHGALNEGIFHTVNSPQTVTLQAGWNQLFVRGYALDYNVCFGAVVKADPAIPWRLRLAATPVR